MNQENIFINNKMLKRQQNYSNESSPSRKKLFQMESRARIISKQLSADESTYRNRKQFEEMELQLKKHQEKLKRIKKDIITKRMEELETMRRQRELFTNATNQSLFQIKKKQQEKQFKLEELQRRQRQEEKNHYQKALQERRKFYTPINFQQLKKHEKQYIQSKMKTEESSLIQEQDDHGKKKSPRKKTRVAQSVIEEYDFQRNFQNSKKKAIKEHLMKRKRYGNDVQKQYMRNRVKTQNTRQEQLERDRIKKIREREEYLKSLKKPKLHPVFNFDQSEQRELKKLRTESRLSPEQKIQQLNLMTDNYDLKLKRGNTDALDRLCRANLVKADLYLNLI